MDPISLSTAVASVLAAIPKLILAASQFSSASTSARRLAHTITTEVHSVKTVLSHLDEFLRGEISAKRDRKRMILVDQLLETITGLVTTFVELQQETEGLVAKTVKRNGDVELSVWERGFWEEEERGIRNILADLGCHKQSLNLMLTILLCNSMKKAESCKEELVEREESSIRNLTRSTSMATIGSEDRAPRPSAYAFEKALYEALPYRRVLCKDANATTDTSSVFSRTFCSSRVASGAFSQLSGVSLEAISNLSMVALPIRSEELSQLVNGGSADDLVSESSKSSLPRKQSPFQALELGHVPGPGGFRLPFFLGEPAQARSPLSRLTDSLHESYSGERTVEGEEGEQQDVGEEREACGVPILEQQRLTARVMKGANTKSQRLPKLQMHNDEKASSPEVSPTSRGTHRVHDRHRVAVGHGEEDPLEQDVKRLLGSSYDYRSQRHISQRATLGRRRQSESVVVNTQEKHAQTLAKRPRSAFTEEDHGLFGLPGRPFTSTRPKSMSAPPTHTDTNAHATRASGIVGHTTPLHRETAAGFDRPYDLNNIKPMNAKSLEELTDVLIAKLHDAIMIRRGAENLIHAIDRFKAKEAKVARYEAEKEYRARSQEISHLETWLEVIQKSYGQSLAARTRDDSVISIDNVDQFLGVTSRSPPTSPVERGTQRRGPF